jgi:hypothetical protein
MSPRTELTLHSLLAVFLFVLTFVVVDVAAYVLANMQGLRGKRMDTWMLWASGIGGVMGFAVFFSYQAWVLPKRLRGLNPPLTAQELESARKRDEAVARVEAQQEALRNQLRATPGLERYAPLVGHSMIGSVEDARVLDVRVRELEADPRRAKYAERVFKGEAITDAMIEYWEDPSARVLCSYFGTVEADIRKTDSRARKIDDRTLNAWLGFDFDALKAQYGIGPPLTFWRRPFGPEFYGRGEDNYDGLEEIKCPEHGCKLVGSAHWRKFPAAQNRPTTLPEAT